MDNTLTNLVTLGLTAITCGLLLLLSMVFFELGPVARLTRHRQWLLVAALGSGIIAFVFKILLVLAISSFPQHTIEIESQITALERVHEIPPTNTSTTAKRYAWIPLPERRSARNSVATRPKLSPYVWQALPEQAPSPPVNPTTPEKVSLGKQLFFDPQLSRDGTVACVSCHDLFSLAGSDGRPNSLGIEQQTGTRNAPTVWNAAFQAALFWDGRATSLEEQVKGPLINPLEMGMPSLEAVVERVRKNKQYREAFATAFGPDRPITIDLIAKAIAAYERTLITPDTPYDRFVGGDLYAMTPAQVRGMALFQSFGCINCHFGPNFSAASLFDNRSPRRIFPVNPTAYEQRYPLLLTNGERGVWRVPSLRNVALTGPWLHNGSVNELEEVVRIMAAAQLGQAGHYLLWSETEGTLQEIKQPAPSDQEVADIVTFLHALSSKRLQSKMELPHDGEER